MSHCPEVEEVLASVKEVQAEKKASEIESFIRYLEKRCDFDKKHLVLKSDLKTDFREYCETHNLNFTNDKAFDKIINEGIITRVCEVFNMTTDEYKNTYNKTGRGKNISVKGDKDWRYSGISLKELPNSPAIKKTEN